MKIFIYGLHDPRNNELRYVGKAINLTSRLRSHIDFARDDVSCPKSDWIKELLAEDLEPIISVLEETTEEGWGEAEIRWIADCRAKGLKLFNVADGGPNPPDWMGRKQSSYHVQKRVETRKANGSYGHSKETREKISKNRKGKATGQNNPFYGKTHPEEIMKRIVAANTGRIGTFKGKHHSEETKQKISEALKGNILSEEHKRKIGEKSKGRKLSTEHIEKLRQVNLGKPVSEETKNKLREANLGKTHSEETKKKIGLLSASRPPKSEETRQKLSVANTGKQRSEEQKVEMSHKQQSMWQDPEYRAKMLEAQKKRREREAFEKGI